MSTKITTAKLFSLLQAQKGATFVTVLMETKPDMRKKGNPYYGQVTKRSRLNATINFSYGNALQKAVETELKRKVEAVQVFKRTWGERIGKTCLITHKGTLYVEMKPNAAAKSTYTVKDKRISANELKSFLPEKKEQLVPILDVRINNIKEIVLDGTTYTVED